MADIFISYARADRDKVEKLAAALEAEGWSVWWDRNIQSGAEFSSEIERELHAAKAVIVCWSEEGAKSRWVRDEATLASRENKLKTVSLDGSEPPIGYMQYHALDMSGWKGGRAEASFIELSAATRTHFERLASGEENTQSEVVTPATKPGGGNHRTLIAGGAVAALALIGIISFFVFGKPQNTEPQNGVSAQTAAALEENSIAVLPFVDLSPDNDQEYFSDGISEELLNVLAQVPDLQVAGRTSSFAFKNENRDLREIGRILNVAHLLEGSVRKAGDKVRITAQLIRADNGFHLWSQTYDRELTDIFAVQDEIAGAILKEMRDYLPGMEAKLAEAPRADIRAYELFLRAREMMTQVGGVASYEEAVGLLDQAIAIDGSYAPALSWRAYAEAKLSRGWAGIGYNDLEKARPVIKEFADRALAADPQSADAQFALGAYYLKSFYSQGEDYYDQAVAALRKAISLRPNFSQAQSDLALLLSNVGQHEEATKLLEAVLANDPGHRDANETYFFIMKDLGRFDEAEAALDRWVEFRPSIVMAKRYRSELLMAEGKIAEGLKLIEDIDPADDDEKDYLFHLNNDGHSTLGDSAYLRSSLEIAPDESHKQNLLRTIAILEGDNDAAADIAAEHPYAKSNPQSVIQFYIINMTNAGRTADAVAAYEEIVKTPEAAISTVDACGCRGMESLIAALRAEGHPDADKVLALWDDMAKRKSELYAKSFGYHVLEADRHLFHGDQEAAAKSYARAMDNGFRSALFANHSAWYRHVPETSEFDALRDRMRSLINTERKKLNMAPL